MKLIIITKVTIDNFKIYRHQEFIFGYKKVVFLTGANGFGKTTLIDAIEWCLTGNISRVKKCYGERNTKQTEIDRAENKKGIIKNSDSGKEDIVKIIMTLEIDNKEVKVFREQKEDSLYVETELKYEGDVSLEIDSLIKLFIANDKFYKYHVCDIYKSHNFLNSSRQEIKNEFSDFIKPQPLADNFNKKLMELQVIISNNVNSLKTSKTSQVKIDTEKKELESIITELESVDYPQIKFYEEEDLSIGNDGIEKVREQLGNIRICGYNIVESKIPEIISYYEAKEKDKNLDELIEIVNIKESDLHIAIENSYYDVKILEDTKIKIKDNYDEITNVKNSKKISDIDITAEIYSEIEANLIIMKDSILDIELKLHKKQSDIMDKEKGNEIITALSNLVVNKEGIIKYRNEENKKCPLCGSDEKFIKISKTTDLAVEAEIYLNKNKSNLANMKKDEKESIENINIKFEEFKQYINEHINEILKVNEGEKTNFNEYYKKTKDFFDKLKKANISIDENYKKNIKESKAETIKQLKNEKFVKSDLEMIKNIITVIDYKADLDNIRISSLKKMQIDMKQLCNVQLLVSNFTFKQFNQKLLFITNILNNSKIHKKELLIKKYIDDNTFIDNEITELNMYNEKTKKISGEIDKKRSVIEKLELEAVGPYLYKIFTKVIKHTAIRNINFKRDSSRVAGGATFTDQSGNNILNTFSQGQLGVFMLSYFFANMFKRNEETPFKTYFIDDVTSCMDDMNILSFVDIIKYQLYQNDGVINQFFFSTCNGDLEKLFLHKMKSFNIEYINYKFNSYARGEVFDMDNKVEYFGIN
ncbi:AAA family ATPase [Clostridium estertheticum]|uniref:AAA family ATPase n=1 Tax=Clostridium estertheticum TaxID=238834 RepID=A0AA47I5H6_9CLOT|nr:AAA family ATPase [Clostridium estertheticum]MBU3156336.1 hypothetical protein [Clostridium estertheticum]WAG59603.1 AAA family ATPase [Clostridium estertheticum]